VQFKTLLAANGLCGYRDTIDGLCHSSTTYLQQPLVYNPGGITQKDKTNRPQTLAAFLEVKTKFEGLPNAAKGKAVFSVIDDPALYLG
jgi:hypothetical protein